MPMFRRRHRDFPELNTTSTADISFMLLVFFLVTSSMDTDKGLKRQLPPVQEEKPETEQIIRQRNVLKIELDDTDQLTCGGDTVSLAALQGKIEQFIKNEANNPDMPEKRMVNIPMLGRCAVADRHIIAVKAHRHTSYNAYFDMQNAIVAAYHHLRTELAQQRFGRTWEQCTQEQREALMTYYPQRISEDIGATPVTANSKTKGGEQ